MESRRQLILKEVEEYGRVRVSDLSKKYDCSEVTIRSDIRALETEGLILRTRGGAKKLPSDLETAISFSDDNNKKPDLLEERLLTAGIYQNKEAKMSIARKAYYFVEDNDTIILDESSTTYYLATYIRENTEKKVTVVTNSLLISWILSDLGHVNLYQVGGYIGSHLTCALGDNSVSQFNRFHVKKAFIGCRGVDFNVGLTSLGSTHLQIKRAIINAADDVTVLVDSTKFGAGYLETICPMESINRIITDAGIPNKYLNEAHKADIDLIISD